MAKEDIAKIRADIDAIDAEPLEARFEGAHDAFVAVVEDRVEGTGRDEALVASRFAGPRLRLSMTFVTSVFTVIVCALVAWHSWQFVSIEREFESEAFTGMPAWIMQIVIPFAFAVMGLRYGAYAVGDVMRLVRGEAPRT